MKAPLPIRIRAIFNFLYFGIMPSWVYEKQRHYRCSYWVHLRMNMSGLVDWVMLRENDDDIAFVMKPCKYFRWQ